MLRPEVVAPAEACGLLKGQARVAVVLELKVVLVCIATKVAAGETSKTVQVAVKGDEIDEPDERFFVDLSDPAGATVTDGRGQGTIVDDDEPAPGAPGVSIGDVSMVEGDAGTTDAAFAVSLSEPSADEVRVAYATADDSALAPGDYAAGAGTVVFAPGEVSQTVAVAVAGDEIDEPDERFFVDLSDPAGATVTDGRGQGTIVDDDEPAQPPPPPPPGGSGAPGAQPRGGSAQPRGGGILGLRRSRCVRLAPRGRGRVGPARLGRSRKRHRRALAGVRRRSRAAIDSYCVAGGGALRIGYPTRRLKRSLARRARRALRTRAVVILTTNPNYKLRGIRPGTTTRTLKRRLRRERRIRTPKTTWYLANAKGARLVFRTRKGRVLELGLANTRLTKTNRAAKQLLKTWRP